MAPSIFTRSQAPESPHNPHQRLVSETKPKSTFKTFSAFLQHPFSTAPTIHHSDFHPSNPIRYDPVSVADDTDEVEEPIQTHWRGEISTWGYSNDPLSTRNTISSIPGLNTFDSRDLGELRETSIRQNQMASLASAIRIPGIPDSSDGSTKEGDLYRQLERKNSNSIMNKIPRRLSFDGLRSRSSKKERTISGNEPLLRRKRSIFDKAENDEQSDQLSERRPSSQMSTKSGHPLALPSIRAFRTRFTVKDKSGGLLANAKADIARKEKSKMEGSRFMTARPASLGSYVGREYVAEMSKLMGTIRLMQDKPQALETQPIKEISAPFIPPNRPSHPPPPTHPRIEPRRSSLMDAVLSPNRQRVSRTPGMPLYERTNSSVLSPAQDDASVCDPVRSPLVASFSLDIVKPQKSRRSSLNDHFDIDVPSRKQSLTELRDAFVRMRSISDADLSISGSSEDKGIPPVPELDKALIKMKGSVSNTQSVGRDGDDEMSEAASGQGSQWETMSRSVTAISTLTTSTNLVEQLEKKQGTGWWSEARLQHGEIPSVPPAHETSEPDIQYHNIPVQRRNTGPRPSLVADSTWSSATGKSISESSAMSKQSDNQQSTSSLDEDATPTKRQAQKGPFVSNRISPALLERTLWLNKREASPRKMTAVTEVTELMGMIEGLKEKHSLETDVLLSALGGQKVEIKCLKDEVNSLQKTVKAGEDERELLRVEIRELTVALELERQIGKAIVAVDAKVTKSETVKSQIVDYQTPLTIALDLISTISTYTEGIDEFGRKTTRQVSGSTVASTNTIESVSECESERGPDWTLKLKPADEAHLNDMISI